jgi:two-component system response regulator NreC
MKVVGEAGDAETALPLIRTLTPDVAVVDLDLPGIGGLELTEQLRQLPSPPVVLVLTMHHEDRIVNAALDRGAMGYLAKESAATELVNAIRAVLRGKIFVSASLAGALVRRARRAETLRDETPGLARLTPSELRVLKLLSDNKTSRQMARHLFISPRTIETHRAHIAEKLGLQGRNALLRFALEHRDEL